MDNHGQRWWGLICALGCNTNHMDHFKRFVRQVRGYLLVNIMIGNLLLVATWWLGSEVLQLNATFVLVILIGAAIGISILMAFLMARRLAEPVRSLWQAILHVSPEHEGTPAPNLEQTSRLGRELVTSLSLQVYQLASSAGPGVAKRSNNDIQAAMIANNLPVPLLVIDKNQNIVFVNASAQKYLRINGAELIGKNMYSVIDLAFPTEYTFDTWLNETRASKAVATKSWEHVRLKLPDSKSEVQFDMAAYYTKDNPAGIETIITMFDHTATYSQNDQGISFVALAVHELRAPLTMLRGYIEVFEEELDGKLTPELADFMHKMQVSAQQLSAFVNNILNVARIEADQMVLQLNEENWSDIVRNVGNDLNLRAQVHGKAIEFDVAPNLPTVGADRVSLYEVLSNLLDNAIKYSGKSQKILVKSYLTKDGLIETTVQDYGVGITENVLPNLFEKFYRSHRTQSQVGGTGLGLYLSKSIIDAHGGQIWVRSKEGQGTTFGFTLLPYIMVAHKLKSDDNKDIVRGAHGWIKNHSLYRR